MQDWAFWGVVLTVANVIFAVGVTIHAVLWKRDSRSVIGWVGLAWLAPVLGACAYLCFGINRIERKAVKLKLHATGRLPRFKLSPQDRQQIVQFAEDYPSLVGLAKAGRRLTGRDIRPGNSVEPLCDGDQAFPAMLSAIDEAQSTISLLTYIFDYDAVGRQFLEALTKARKRGVEVRVLIDDVGSKYSRPNMVPQLREAGITAESFLRTRVPRMPVYANLRNHRKILVVDGKVGFTGGTNIREGHCLRMEPAFPVRCLHFQLQGPVVAQLQEVFVDDWTFTCGESEWGKPWFPSLERAGPVWARGIEHGPDEHFEKLADILAAALASAGERVRIVTPYFLPSSPLIQALNVAALRDVDVEIYLPSKNNVPIVGWAATAQLWQILEKGCRVFYTSPPFDHTKLMLVDDVWSLIGSTNWDPRSLRLNFEFNVECYDPPLAKALNEIVDRKAQGAHEVTLDEVNNRSFPIRLRDGLARLMTPYL